jgi:hypothetical protein
MCACVDVPTEENPDPEPKAPISGRLLATVTVESADCTELDGITAVLTMQSCQIFPMHWFGWVENPASCWGPNEGTFFTFDLLCHGAQAGQGDYPYDWKLAINHGYNGVPYDGWWCDIPGPFVNYEYYSTEESTCDPLVLVFNASATRGTPEIWTDPCTDRVECGDCGKILEPDQYQTITIRIVITEVA